MRALIGTRKGLFELTRHAHHDWRLQMIGFIADPVTMLLHDARSGHLYAALKLGHFGVKLHRRNAGSTDWTEIAVPTYPPQPDKLAEGEAEWKLHTIWSMATGGADQPGVLWAGTLPGGLFRSADHGASWQLVESLWNLPERKQWMGGGAEVPGIHSICVDPRNSQRVLVGVSCGGAWLTEDGGASWVSRARGMRANYMPPELAEVEATQDPHLITQCAAQPDHYWCQHHCGIWRSSDGAASWQEVSPVDASGAAISNFGFAVAVHPQDANSAWFVPAVSDQRRIPVDAALAVHRTRDGGASFSSLRTGLPQQDCYDLIYRHGLDVASDGQTLLMGSTTGGLWVSENGGDVWHTVGMNLPPIYALKFA
ncbi:MAG: hypothetical protein RL748_2340 [Pseudomonadota bacterium]|jgi:hypothetical protein